MNLTSTTKKLKQERDTGKDDCVYVLVTWAMMFVCVLHYQKYYFQFIGGIVTLMMMCM